MKSEFKLKSGRYQLLMFSLFAMMLLFISQSCQDELGLLPSFKENITSDYLLNGDLVIFHESEQIFRHQGKPGSSIILIGTDNLSDYEDCFALYIKSGANSVGTVSSAKIELDGQVLLNTSDFSNLTKLYTFEICNLSSQSTLSVAILGTPGSYLDIWIEGKKRSNIIFNPNLTYGSVKDIDGNTYKTILIGTQTWMAENLKTTRYNDGTTIPCVTDQELWNSQTTPAYCWYENDETNNKSTYGALYNWLVVDVNRNGGKNVCPTDWHVPSDSEWSTLTTYLGGELVAGTKLKEIGTIHWLSPNDDATNESGFTALPAGGRATDFYNIKIWSYFWSATFDPLGGNNNEAWYRKMLNNWTCCERGSYWIQTGFSIRCIKDN